MKARCYNCKHASPRFELGGVTHHHCQSPQTKSNWDAGVAMHPWDTLRVFSDKCKEHEFKEINNKQKINN